AAELPDQAPPGLQQRNSVLSRIDRACRQHELPARELRQLRRQGNLGVALEADELMREPRDVNGWRHIALSRIAAQVSGCIGRYAGKAGCVLQSLIQPA